MKPQRSLVLSMGIWALAAGLAAAFALTAQAAPAIKAGQLGSPHLQLSDSYSLSFSAPKAAGTARALSMGSADFDNDGFPDLVSAYASDKGGLISLHGGNEQAWSPSSPASQALVRSGVFPPGFENTPTLVNVAVAPDLLALGDFDRDGNVDLVFAKRGDSTLYFLPGTGVGFASAHAIALGAGIDALASGQIDLPDGMTDLAVAVSNAASASLLSYADRLEGINAKPDRTALTAPADALAISNLDSSPMGDVAILSNGKLAILHGRNPRLAAPSFNRLEALPFDFAIQAFALGNFIWDRAGNAELALLKDDGSVQIAARGALDTRSYSIEEVRALRRSQLSAKSSSVNYWQPGSDSAWKIAESTASQMSKASALRSPLLLSAQLAGQNADDLLVVDTVTQIIKVLTQEGDARKSYAFVASLAPVAVLSLQTSAFVRPSLIVLGAGAQAPSIVPSAAKATFTVSKTADTNDGTCNADCSLREAISAANAAAGADTVTMPAGTYTLTIANGGGTNEDNNATGDLDINGPTTLTGAGAASTIIQAGTTNANGIDKVLAFNPFCTTAVTSSLADVTVRFGRNTQPPSAPDFSYTGGGMDVCNTSAGGFAMTNTTVTDNNATTGYGGGINFDSVAPANGAFSITGGAATNNRTSSAASVLKNGGGINLFADQHAVNITNTVISGNTAALEGGGIYVRHSNSGAVTISGSIISANVAASRGGGITDSQFGIASLVIQNDSVIQNNISQGTAVSTASRGGGIFFSPQAGTTTSTVRETTITGNQAVTGTDQFGGGMAAISGQISAQFNRVTGNTAGTASGFHNAGATVTGLRNWWGCNAGPASVPCNRSTNVSGTLTTSPHLILRHVASPTTIFVTQTSTLTADFLRDSGGGVIALTDLDAMIGTSKVFNGAVFGGLSAVQTSIQANGTATATFTATGAGAGSANSVVDAHTETAAITINRLNSITTITSDLPDPSVVGAAVPVNFTVTPVAPGVAAPTGNVVVTISGGGETCTGTVAAGTCSITLTSAGARTLTANYVGDTPYNPSSDTEAHQVLVPPVLSINDVTLFEGNGGTVNATFTVSLTSAPVASAVTFNIATADGTAIAPTDYVARTLTAQTIPIGMSTYTFIVAVNGDTTVEPNETFNVNVSSVTGATVGDGSGLGTINNDDVPAASITVLPASTLEDGPGNLTYTVTLNQAPIVATTVNITTGGTAISPADYTGAISNVSFGIGVSTQTIVVDPAVDAITEGDETVIVTVAAGSSYSVGSPVSASGTITDDDLLLLSINDVSITEGISGTQTLTFTVTRTGTTASASGFNFATADSSATTGNGDYFAASGTLSIPAGGPTGTTTVNVTVNGDATFENNETFFVNLTAPTNASISDAQGVGTITNDDTAPTLAINDVSILEGNAGTQTLMFSVTRTGLTALPASFTAVTAPGTATTPSDYLAALAGSTTIAAGSATGSTTLTATINGDALVEPNESFVINLTAPTNATFADNQGTGTITNDDSAGVVLVQSGGNTAVTEGGATDTYTVVLTSEPSANVSIVLSGTQVTAAPTPLLFSAANWNTPQIVTVTAIDDAVVEGNHSGSVSSAVTSADGNYNGISVAAVTVAITDNDTPSATVLQSGGTTVVTEGAATDIYTVVLGTQPSSNVTVTPTGTQVSVSAPLIFTNANWNTPQTVTVTALDDNVVEGAHTGSITHVVSSADSNYSNLSIAGVPDIAITDNDSATTQFAPISVSQLEASSAMAFTVTLSNPVASGVTLAVNSTAGTSTSPADFTAITAGTVSFPANSTTAQTVTVMVANDALDEDDETFTLALSNLVATGNVTLGTAIATGIILNDDALPVLSASNVTQAEGDAVNTLNFTVNLSPVSGRAVTFTRATLDGTAVSTGPNADFAAIAASTVTIPAGQTSLTIPVTINGDTVLEGNESFSLNLSAATNATPSTLSATATLSDDDQQPTTTTITSDQPDASVVGQSYTVDVTVAAQSTSPLGTVSITDGTGPTCGPLTLTPGTAPNSTASCALISTSAGNKTLTATYAPASSAFAASADTEAHTVNAAATTLSLSGPSTALLSTSTNYSVNLQVSAPGAGVPAGTVSISNGSGSQCQITFPTVTPNCNLIFPNVGTQTISASFVPGNGDFSGATSSTLQTLVFAVADLSVSKSNAVTTYRTNDLLVYTIVLSNLGADPARNVRLQDLVPTTLSNVAWTCSAQGGADCPAAGGVGNIDQLYPLLPSGSQLSYVLSGNVIGLPQSISNTASIQLPANGTVQDPSSGNNSATDTDGSELLFRNGFEAQVVNAQSGSIPLATALSSLRSQPEATAQALARAIISLDDSDGEALRVYARVLDGQIQLALATRQGNALKLGYWQNYAELSSGLTLTWTATRTVTSWRLQEAILQ